MRGYVVKVLDGGTGHRDKVMLMLMLLMVLVVLVVLLLLLLLVVVLLMRRIASFVGNDERWGRGRNIMRWQ